MVDSRAYVYVASFNQNDSYNNTAKFGTPYAEHCTIIFHGAAAPSGPGHPHCQGFTIKLRHTHSVGQLWTSDPTRNTHNRHPCTR